RTCVQELKTATLMRTSGVSLGKIPLFGRRRTDIMINFSHCQEKNKAHIVSRMGHRAWSIGQI
ncbi:MAG: hypothetical protein OEV18_12730, partial [Deltaproteobacteria bacterium]|nr:hypothetical protein [Deltaproteobacteria bacterium]